MKYTLLEMVQHIMDGMDSDDVSAITDTDESEQVAEILRTVYFQMIANDMITEHNELFQFTTVGTLSKNYLKIPTTIQKVYSWRYNKKESGATDDNFAEVDYKEPNEFFKLIYARLSSGSEMTSQTDPNSTLTYKVPNDTPPTYWTSFDDEYIATDSFDAAVDATGLVGTKTMGWGREIPTWTVSGSFTPDLDDNLFPFLLAEAKSLAFVELKQTTNSKAERQAREQKVRSQNDKFRTESQEIGANSPGAGYGRHGTNTPGLGI